MCAFLSVCALLHSSILVIVVDTFVHSNQFCVCISHFTSSFVFVYECLRVFARVCVCVCVSSCFQLFCLSSLFLRFFSTYLFLSLFFIAAILFILVIVCFEILSCLECTIYFHQQQFYIQNIQHKQ